MEASSKSLDLFLRSIRSHESFLRRGIMCSNWHLKRIILAATVRNRLKENKTRGRNTSKDYKEEGGVWKITYTYLMNFHKTEHRIGPFCLGQPIIAHYCKKKSIRFSFTYNQVECMWQSEGRGQPLEDTQVQGRWAKAGPACRSAPQKTVRRAPAASAEHSARCICGAQGPWLRE